MFNLLVSGDVNSWEGRPFIIEIDRCVREYTDKEIVERYSELRDDQIEQVQRFPCIFAYEQERQKDPKFGLIKNVAIKKERVKIEYDIIEIEGFLNWEDLSNMAFDLDISGWEMNRTHWSIKDVNLPKELALKGIKLPQWAQKLKSSVDIRKHNFDVALSFPGEIRSYVESIAAELERLMGPDSYFYDSNYTAQLARPSLDELLQDIYRNRSKLIVVFLCEEYQEKEWCGIEFRAIKEIIMQRQHERIMFVKMDEGKVEGIFKTDGYVDGRSHGPEKVAHFIAERISILKK